MHVCMAGNVLHINTVNLLTDSCEGVEETLPPSLLTSHQYCPVCEGVAFVIERQGFATPL